MTDVLARARAFLADDPDPTTRAELEAIVSRGDLAELSERMAGPLEFGTAGLRGVLGAGESRMNRAVVLRTTAGLARHVLASVPNAHERGVVVGFDGRRMSRELAGETARALAGAGLRVHLFSRLGPTPLTAFAVRHLGAAAGVMVTASHNPPEYNGYKVYWENGAQIVPPHDREIARAIDAAPGARHVPVVELDEARARGLVVDVPAEVTGAYLAGVGGLSRDRRGRDLVRIAYTPLHGTGDELAHAALARFGFGDVASVPEQREPDGAFPTVAFPNPEEPGVMDRAVALAKSAGKNLVLANDPDADRLAVCVPGGDGGFRQLSGNEIGVLLGEYALRKAEGGADRLVVTTIVSSPMLGHIARTLGVRYAETLTGFKWITTRAMELERQGARFVFGYEEALGYTVGTVVRDKDGISAAAVFAELAAAAAAEGRSVEGELERIARTYGLYVSAQRSVTKKGQAGAAEIAATMDRLRAAAPNCIGAFAVEAVRDVLAGTRKGADGSVTPLDLPASNVLIFDLERGARVVARPSGTEPKIKFYFDVREELGRGEPYDAARARASASLDALVAAFLELVA